MRELFQVVLTQPIYNVFVGLYNLIPDVGIVIILITIIIKLVLYPLTAKSIKSQKALTELQPKLDDIRAKHKGNQQIIAQETMKLYKENNVNPFASCLPLLIQLPILLAFYWVLRLALGNDSFNLLYSFIQKPEIINTNSLGIIDLAQKSIILAVLAGGSQFVQTWMMSRKKAPSVAGTGAKDENMLAAMNKNMLYFMPIMTIFIGAQLPAGLTLYWLVSTLLTAGQQLVVFKQAHSEGQSSIK